MPQEIRFIQRGIFLVQRVLVGCAILLSANAVNALAAGDTAANFLKIPAGARASGLGEAYTSVADDVSAVYWNPAGLSSLKSNEFTISHNIWFQNIQHTFAAFAIPLDLKTYPQPFARNTIGFSITYLGMDGIERRTSNTASPEGSFGASDMAISVAFSRNMAKISGNALSFGTALKFIRQNIDSYSADAVAVDLGFMYPFGIGKLPFRAGAAVQNLGSEVKFINDSYPLPLTFKTGISFLPLAAYSLPLAVSFDVEFPSDNDVSWKIGTEYMAAQLFSIRLGYNNRNEIIKNTLTGASFSKTDTNISIFTGFMAGVGMNIPLSRTYKGMANRMSLDYAFVPYGELGETHRISMGIKW